jgi:hypothetical protein
VPHLDHFPSDLLVKHLLGIIETEATFAGVYVTKGTHPCIDHCPFQHMKMMWFYLYCLQQVKAAYASVHSVNRLGEDIVVFGCTYA